MSEHDNNDRIDNELTISYQWQPNDQLSLQQASQPASDCNSQCTLTWYWGVHTRNNNYSQTMKNWWGQGNMISDNWTRLTNICNNITTYFPSRGKIAKTMMHFIGQRPPIYTTYACGWQSKGYILGLDEKNINHQYMNITINPEGGSAYIIYVITDTQQNDSTIYIYNFQCLSDWGILCLQAYTTE